MGNLKDKILVVSEYAPPSIEGIPIQLGNLLKYFPRDSYYIITQKLKKARFLVDPDTKLDAQYYYFRTDYFCNTKFLRGQHIQPIIAFITVPLLIFKIIKIFTKYNFTKILAPSNSGPFFISAYVASFILKVPLYSLFFDVYSDVVTNSFQKIAAKSFEPKILKQSNKIFVTTNEIGEYYRKICGKNYIVINHSWDDQLFSAIEKKGNGKTIVFTGMISRGDDRIEYLLDAIKEMPDVNLELFVPTKRNLNIDLPNVKISYAKREEIPAILCNADILYLPRTFFTYHSNLMKKTCLPSKIADYLAAGKPILVFAPEDSCLSAYAKKHGIALILNELNSSKLSQYFYKLLEDNSLRKKLVKNVKKIKEKHRASVVSLKLQEALFG